MADPDISARDRWTILARDSSLGSTTLISDGHVDKASVRRFCVAGRCWSAAFRFNSALNSAFLARISLAFFCLSHVRLLRKIIIINSQT